MIRTQLLPVLEGCPTWMLQTKIQANREEHTDTGPLRKHKSLAPGGVKEDFLEKAAIEPGFKE